MPVTAHAKIAPPDTAEPVPFAWLDIHLQHLANHRDAWVKTTVGERIALLTAIKTRLRTVAADWAETAAVRKGIAKGSPLVGEEWMSGPYAVMAYCNQMLATLARIEGKQHLDDLPVRDLPGGQIAARVLPHSLWDRLLLSGVRMEVWMEPGVTRANLAQHTGAAYDPANPDHQSGGVALVLGAGNIAAIAPLDVFHKLFAENQVVLLKMNPINDYLIEFLELALAPLIEHGVLRIVRGDAAAGAYLSSHPLVDSIHITGAGATHDAIIWGAGEEGRANKAAGTPLNGRRITSELGAVCPTIVVPGPWSAADIAFQAEQVATQKLHNSGFNCVASQVLVLPAEWERKQEFLTALEATIGRCEGRALYYPGAAERLRHFRSRHPGVRVIPRADGPAVLIAHLPPDGGSDTETAEVFAPAWGITELAGSHPEAFLRAAIDYANRRLHGTLGANVVIHPRSIAAIGRRRFEELLLELRYGTIAINAWTGLGFLTPQATWGAFPGHTLADVQSGIGAVHNTCLFDRPQRTVIEAPFRPFPRGLLSGSLALLPRPPWFVTNRRAATLGRLLVDFQYQPSLFKLPRIFYHALRG